MAQGLRFMTFWSLSAGGAQMTDMPLAAAMAICSRGSEYPIRFVGVGRVFLRSNASGV